VPIKTTDNYLLAQSLIPVLNDSKLIYRRIKNLTQNKGVYSINGNWIPLDAKTLCVHGDHPNAASLLKSALSYLEINET
jgi:UPF0271 protein